MDYHVIFTSVYVRAERLQIAEITSFISYVKTIQMNYKEDKIDYEYLKKLLRSIFNREVSNKEAFVYDWVHS